MFGELCERCGCFLELHKRDLLTDPFTPRTKGVWFCPRYSDASLISSTEHAHFVRGKCLIAMVGPRKIKVLANRNDKSGLHIRALCIYIYIYICVYMFPSTSSH